DNLHHVIRALDHVAITLFALAQRGLVQFAVRNIVGNTADTVDFTLGVAGGGAAVADPADFAFAGADAKFHVIFRGLAGDPGFESRLGPFTIFRNDRVHPE